MLTEHIPDTKIASPIPKFPATSRDVTLIVDKDIEAYNILQSIKDLNEVLVEDLQLFDVFEGYPIPEGRKSISLRIIYRSSGETLDVNRVNRIHKNITDRLMKKFDATLPAE